MTKVELLEEIVRETKLQALQNPEKDSAIALLAALEALVAAQKEEIEDNKAA